MKIRKPYNKYTWLNNFSDGLYLKLNQTYKFTNHKITKLRRFINFNTPINHSYLLKSRSNLRMGRGSSKIIGNQFYILKNKIISKKINIV